MKYRVPVRRTFNRDFLSVNNLVEVFSSSVSVTFIIDSFFFSVCNSVLFLSFLVVYRPDITALVNWA